MNAARWWVAAGLFGLLVLACLPAGVTALDDDFGYLRSVVATLQHGRPWTDDWLEPWAASFSSLSALLYLATHNFYLATYGLLAALATGSFALAAALLRARGFRFGPAVCLAAIGLTFPTVFWKIIEFTGMALYLPCLLGALWAAERRRWGWFLAAWSLALASRQSALAWAMLPLAVAAQTAWRERSVSRAVWPPLVTTAAGGAWFVGLQFAMNKTHAQLVLTDHVFAQASFPAALQVWGIGLPVFAAAAGVGMLFFRPTRFRSVPLVIGIALATLGICLLHLRAQISWEHGALAGPVGRVYLKILVLLGGVGWMFRGGRVRLEICAAALAGLVLLGVRGMVWDYYLLDLAAFGLFGAVVTPEPPGEIAVRNWRRAAGLGCAVLAVVHGLLVLDFKAYLDRSHAVNVATELALRSGRLAPAELSFAPFGFTAWHLHPYFIQHEGRDSANIAGFDCYEAASAVEVGQGYSKPLHVLPRFRHEPPGDRHNLIASGATRYLWFFRAEYFLLRFKSGADAVPATPLPPGWTAPVFPLTEAEWRELIEAPRLTGNQGRFSG